MNKVFKNMLNDEVPKFNKNVVNGLAYIYLKKVESYIDTVFRSASNTYDNGLKYLGYELTTPREAYLYSTKKKEYSNRRVSKALFETSESTVFLVKYFFSFNGETLPPRYLYLPYCTKGGIMCLSNTQVSVSPVLTDRVITPGPDNVFVRLLKDKLLFKSIYFTIVAGGNRTTLPVIYSQIYRKKPGGTSPNTSSRMIPPVILYLLGKYGITEMFKMLFGFIPNIGTTTITEDQYPKDKYVIFESTGSVPKAYKGDNYKINNIKIAIPRNVFPDVDLNNLSGEPIANVLGGVFYILDHYSDRIDLDTLDDTVQWLVMLGYINRNEEFTIDKLYTLMVEHYQSLDGYLDSIVKEKLADSGYHVDSFFDLLGLILHNYTNWTIHHKVYTTSIYNRYLDILYYVCYDITSSIFRANYMLVQQASKKELTIKNVNDILSKHLRTKIVYQLVKTKNPNICINSLEYCGDNLYPKVTSTIALQECGDGVKRATKSGLPPSSRVLTGPDLALGSLLFLTKKLPTPKVRVNPFANINLLTGVIEPDDDIRESLQLLDYMLEGRTEIGS